MSYSKRKRSQNIEAPWYKMSLQFKEKRAYVGGKIKITFRLKSRVIENQKYLQQLLWIDFLGEVKHLQFNGVKLTSSKDFLIKKGKIVFKNSALKLARENINVFDIDYTVRFGSENNAKALVRFHDVIDGHDYYYTKKPPFQASRLFPCFDQPDVMGIHQVDVEAPRAWTVVTSTVCVRKKKLSRMQKWYYEKSIPYPSFQFCFLAGPYEKWTGPHPEDGEIPLTFYGRKSLKNRSLWENLGLCVRHPRDFDYFRNRASDFKKRPTD
jgi:aminopeptidase N